MNINRALCGLAITAVLAGCGSGSSHPVTPVPAASSQGSGASAKLVRAAISISIPRSKASALRSRKFVSPATDGVSVTVTHGTGGVTDYDTTTNYDVSPESASTCAGTDPEVCTLDIPAPIAESPDYDSFAFTLYDEAPGGANNSFGSGAKILGTGTTTAPIAANAQNMLVAYVDGKPASVAFFLNGVTQTILSGDGYLGFTAPLGIVPMDADLDAISGGDYDPYDPAVAIAVTEPQKPAGSTTLSLVAPDLSGDSPPAPACNSSVANKTSVTTCRSKDALSESYLQPATATFDASYYATVSSGTTAVPATSAVYVAPMFVADTTDSATAASGPKFQSGASGVSPVLALDGGTGTVTLHEPGAVIEGSSPTFTASENAGCNGVIASGGINAKSGGSFTIAAVPLASANDTGACTVTFSDTFGGTVRLGVTDVTR